MLVEIFPLFLQLPTMGFLSGGALLLQLRKLLPLEKLGFQFHLVTLLGGNFLDEGVNFLHILRGNLL